MPGFRNNHPQTYLALLTILLNEHLADDFEDPNDKTAVINAQDELKQAFSGMNKVIKTALSKLPA